MFTRNKNKNNNLQKLLNFFFIFAVFFILSAKETESRINEKWRCGFEGTITFDGHEFSTYIPKIDFSTLECILPQYRGPCVIYCAKSLNNIVVKTDAGSFNVEQVLVIEKEKCINVVHDKFLLLSYKDNLIGKFLRKAGNIKNPFTYEKSKTKAFFGKVDEVKDRRLNKEETIKEIYNLVTTAVPKYGDIDTFFTFEEILTNGNGVCRDQALLLNTALQKAGIDSEIVAGNTIMRRDLLKESPRKPKVDHVWVRVNVEGLSFDLDPTWYKDYIKLPPRECL